MTAQARKLVHSDIKPDNPPERVAHYLDVPNMPWEKTKFPGIGIKVLYTDDSGITTALFKLDPGAIVPLHEHTALEQTYVIEGSLEVRRDGDRFVLVEGLHRLEACKALGEETIYGYLTQAPKH